MLLCAYKNVEANFVYISSAYFTKAESFLSSMEKKKHNKKWTCFIWF